MTAVLMLLLRHAAAGQRRLWTGDDRVRPLSVLGARQADALVAPLVAAGPDRILTSGYLRCRQTVEPLAVKTGLPIETADWLGVDVVEQPGAAAVVVGAVRDLAAGDGPGAAVLCTHGEVMSVVLGAVVPPSLLDRAVQDGAPPPPGDKGSVWELTWEGLQVVSARYHPPPA